MAVPSKGQEVQTDFAGMVSNVDRHDLPGGAAAVQVNITCVKEAQLTARSGFRVVTFEN